jgi:hypothetical protein
MDYEKELASFIRTGLARRPVQAIGRYFQGKNASCALGAAYEGMYRLPADAGNVHPSKDLQWFFLCLDTVKSCPAEGCKKKLSLAAVIVHLNDDHLWTREDIADWIEGTPAPTPSTAVR